LTFLVTFVISLGGCVSASSTFIQVMTYNSLKKVVVRPQKPPLHPMNVPKNRTAYTALSIRHKSGPLPEICAPRLCTLAGQRMPDVQHLFFVL
jgi:hypothetical protein